MFQNKITLIKGFIIYTLIFWFIFFNTSQHQCLNSFSQNKKHGKKVIGEYTTRYNYSRGEGAVNVKWRKAHRKLLYSQQKITL